MKEILKVPAYILYTGITQLLSRLTISELSAFNIVSTIIKLVVKQYPRQSLWYLFSKSPDNRISDSARTEQILKELKTNEPLSTSIAPRNRKEHVQTGLTYNELINEAKTLLIHCHTLQDIIPSPVSALLGSKV